MILNISDHYYETIKATGLTADIYGTDISSLVARAIFQFELAKT
jgi:hypothetical protein